VGPAEAWEKHIAENCPGQTYSSQTMYKRARTDAGYLFFLPSVFFWLYVNP